MTRARVAFCPRPILTAVALLTLVAAAGRAAAQDRRGLVWDDRPSIVVADDVNVDLRVKLQLDWRRFDPEIGEETFDFRNLRVGLKGELTKHFDYEIEREITDDWQFGDWKDVYVNWRTFDALSVRGGRFKMPFGLEQNTGPTETDFAYRALASSIIAPGRDKGVAVHGRAFGRGLTYEAGVFQGDGDNGRITEPAFVAAGEEPPETGPSVAARVTVAALRPLPVADILKGLRVGAAYTNAELPEGLNSLRGESLYGTAEFFEPVYTKGRRQRLGAELEWTPGPAGVKAEWMQSREDRSEQSNRNQDLATFVATGWYVSGTWLLTGEKKDASINPRAPLFTGGIGAFELAARYERLSLGSDGGAGTAYTNPRADRLVPNADRIWTLGVNWFPNRWTRLVLNAAHESFDDPTRTPERGTSSFWSGLVRMQVVF